MPSNPMPSPFPARTSGSGSNRGAWRSDVSHFISLHLISFHFIFFFF
jgi:hypothetical protein